MTAKKVDKNIIKTVIKMKSALRILMFRIIGMSSLAPV